MVCQLPKRFGRRDSRLRPSGTAHRRLARGTAKSLWTCGRQPYESWWSIRPGTCRWLAHRFFRAPVPSGCTFTAVPSNDATSTRMRTILRRCSSTNTRSSRLLLAHRLMRVEMVCQLPKRSGRRDSRLRPSGTAHRRLARGTAKSLWPCRRQPYESWCSIRIGTCRWLAHRFFRAPVPSGCTFTAVPSNDATSTRMRTILRRCSSTNTRSSTPLLDHRLMRV